MDTGAWGDSSVCVQQTDCATAVTIPINDVVRLFTINYPSLFFSKGPCFLWIGLYCAVALCNDVICRAVHVCGMCTGLVGTEVSVHPDFYQEYRAYVPVVAL